jgi:hypothetical protein
MNAVQTRSNSTHGEMRGITNRHPAFLPQNDVEASLIRMELMRAADKKNSAWAGLAGIDTERRAPRKACRDCRVPIPAIEILMRPSSEVCMDCRMRRRAAGSALTPASASYMPEKKGIGNSLFEQMPAVIGGASGVLAGRFAGIDVQIHFAFLLLIEQL